MHLLQEVLLVMFLLVLPYNSLISILHRKITTFFLYIQVNLHFLGKFKYFMPFKIQFLRKVKYFWPR